MLSQYRFNLQAECTCPIHPEDGYRMYAELLSKCERSIGDALHKDGTTPVSQYLITESGDWLWTVSLIGTEAEEALGAFVLNQQIWNIRNGKIKLSTREVQIRKILSAEELLVKADKAGDSCRLRFVTPTAFKSKGQYINLPTMRLMVQSLIKQWNGNIPECPIEDEDGEGMEAIAAGLSIRHFTLRDTSFSLKGNRIPGFTGEMEIQNRLSGFQRTMANALLLFAEYSGIGIKTTLGMGGVRRENIF